MFSKFQPQYLLVIKWVLLGSFVLSLINLLTASVVRQPYDNFDVICAFAHKKWCYFEVGRRGCERSRSKLVGVDLSQFLTRPLEFLFVKRVAHNRLLADGTLTTFENHEIAKAVWHQLRFELKQDKSSGKSDFPMATEEFVMKTAIFWYLYDFLMVKHFPNS